MSVGAIMEKLSLSRNYTVFVKDDEIIVAPAENGVIQSLRDREYEQFMADVWVGVVLTLMVVSCICCMCSFLLYHKFQQWKITAVDGQPRPNTLESGVGDQDPISMIDSEPLPNYTLVSGLPTYDEALDQMRKAREERQDSAAIKLAEAQGSVGFIERNVPVKLSLEEFLQVYKNQRIVSPAAPS